MRKYKPTLQGVGDKLRCFTEELLIISDSSFCLTEIKIAVSIIVEKVLPMTVRLILYRYQNNRVFTRQGRLFLRLGIMLPMQITKTIKGSNYSG